MMSIAEHGIKKHGKSKRDMVKLGENLRGFIYTVTNNNKISSTDNQQKMLQTNYVAKLSENNNGVAVVRTICNLVNSY
jgi:hypothetical protein